MCAKAEGYRVQRETFIVEAQRLRQEGLDVSGFSF